MNILEGKITNTKVVSLVFYHIMNFVCNHIYNALVTPGDLAGLESTQIAGLEVLLVWVQDTLSPV